MVVKSFTLQCGKSHAIEPAIGPNGSIDVLSFFPPLESGIDGTCLDIKDDNENILIHVSLRPSRNAIVLNTMPSGKEWGTETYVPLQDSLPSSKAARICILDRGDNYLVTFSDGVGTRFPKLVSQVNEKASSIHYYTKDGRSVLSNPVNVNTHYEEQPSESSASVHVTINLASLTPRSIHLEVNLG